MIKVSKVEYRISSPVNELELNALFSASWPDHRFTEFQSTLQASMTYVCAYDTDKIIGYVNAAWDGKTHAFILDTTVHPEHRRRGVGRELVRCVLEQARRRGVTWVHVDYEPHLRDFYTRCGFRLSEAGVIGFPSEA